MSKIRYSTATPVTQNEPLGVSPGVLAKRVFTKRLYQWCPRQNIEFDPWCDAEYPKTITYNDILDANNIIKREFSYSALVDSKNNRRFPVEVYYKIETFHRTGSYKERGAYYALNKLSPEQRKLGVISASLGNWAMALAYWGQKLNIPVTVVLPVTVSLRNQQACINYGADVVVHGNVLNEAKRKACAILVNSKLNYINGYDHPHVIAAAGTIGIEILEQLPDVYAVLVPVGGGSLLAGIATAIKQIRPGVLVYGIQSNKCPSFKTALEKDGPCQTAVDLGIATSLQVPTVGCNALQTAKNLVDDVVLIQDDWIAKAVYHLIDREKIVVEGAAAITLAALMSLPKPLRHLREKKVVCVLSGGNLEPIMFKCIERAKASDGRLVNINATFPKENIETLKKILNFITHLGVNIIRHDFDRSWHLESYPNDLNVTIICETNDKDHTKLLKRLVNKFFSGICDVQEESFSTSNMYVVIPQWVNKEKFEVNYSITKYIQHNHVKMSSRRYEDFDPNCDPENPKKISFEDIVEATEASRPFISVTPCYLSQTRNDFSINFYYKLETVHKTGSYKERGALNVLQKLPRDKKRIGVVLASLGNQAMGLCHCARLLNIPVVVVMPVNVPLIKLQMCKNMGAKVIVEGNDLQDSQKHARYIAREKGLTYINGRDHPDVLTGYGGVALEILEQVPNMDAVLVPVGTGGLIAAVATVIKRVKPNCLVYGVQSEVMPTFFESLEKGQPVTKPMQNSLAEGIAMPYVGINSFFNALPLVDRMILLKEDWIAQAILYMVEKERFVIEGAAACTVAPILNSLVPELKNKNVVCIMSGGNIDATLLNRSLERGLAASGRMIKFKVGVRADSASMAELLKLLSDGGYNLIRQFMDHIWIDEAIHYLETKIVCQTRDLQHAIQLKRLIEDAYPKTAVFETEPLNDKHMCACYIKK